jgi:hypothetical protein
VIGIAVEPLGDRTLVRVIGNGPILVYKTERPGIRHNSFFPPPDHGIVGTKPDTATRSSNGGFPASRYRGTTIEMTLGSGVAPQIVRDGAQVVVESPADHRATERRAARSPRLMPVSAQKLPSAASLIR